MTDLSQNKMKIIYTSKFLREYKKLSKEMKRYLEKTYFTPHYIRTNFTEDLKNSGHFL